MLRADVFRVPIRAVLTRAGEMGSDSLNTTCLLLASPFVGESGKREWQTVPIVFWPLLVSLSRRLHS